MRHFYRRLDWRQQQNIELGRGGWTYIDTFGLVWIVLALATVVGSNSVRAQQTPSASLSPAAQQVRGSLNVLHVWVGDNSNGQAWKKYLRSETIKQQLSAEEPDAGVLRQVLDQYQSGADGLDRWRFARVRQALQNWIAELESGPLTPQANDPAQDTPESQPSLVDLVTQATEAFEPISDERIAEHRRRVEVAAQRLDAMLARGSYENRMAWHRYLNWESMQKQLSAASPDLQQLNAALTRYYENESGLELSEFRKVRDGLLDYMNAVYFSDETEMEPYYRQQMEQLAQKLRTYEENPNSKDALAIGRIVGFLVQAEQASDVVSAVRKNYWEPNLYARVSRDLAAAGFRDRVNETTGVRENILGTAVYGTAYMQGNVDLLFVPNSEQAQLQIQLNGAANSNNVGYNRGVQIYSVGYTALAGSKTLLVDERGIHLVPARASANTNTNITGVSAKSNLVRKIAWKRIRQSEGQAENVASHRAAGRLAARMDSETAGLVADANQKFHEKFRDPLLRKDEFPEVLSFSTTADALQVKGLQVNRFQLGASDSPPALNESYDLALRAHESLVSNFSEAVLGGVKLTDEKAAELMKDLTGEVPEELQITQDSDPWSITFSNTQPIRAEFRDGGFKIIIRGKQFTRDTTPVNEDMEISATYKVERTELGLRLQRVGDVEAAYVDGGFESATKLAVKTFMRKKFAALFKPELETDGLVLPGRWERAGKLALKQFSSDDGWVVLGWQQPADVERLTAIPQ